MIGVSRFPPGTIAKKEILYHLLGRTAERVQPGDHCNGRVGIDRTEMDTGRENRRNPVPATGQQKNRLQGIPLVGTQMNFRLAIKIQTNIVINCPRTGVPGTAGNRTIGACPNGIGKTLAVIRQLNSKERQDAYRQDAFEHRHTNMMSYRGHTTKIIHQIREF
jgi:hypothetical protein